MPRGFEDWRSPRIVEALPAEDVDWIVITKTDVVEAGKSDPEIIRADEGYLYEVIGMYLNVPPPSGASSGSHFLSVATELGNLGIIRGDSNYDDYITFNFYQWVNATLGEFPSDRAAQASAVRGLRFDENNGISINYVNYTNANQTGSRTYIVWVRKIRRV